MLQGLLHQLGQLHQAEAVALASEAIGQLTAAQQLLQGSRRRVGNPWARGGGFSAGNIGRNIGRNVGFDPGSGDHLASRHGRHLTLGKGHGDRITAVVVWITAVTLDVHQGHPLKPGLVQLLP